MPVIAFVIIIHNMSSFEFNLTATNQAARAGRLVTRRGELTTPLFMPVATLGAVKTLTPAEVFSTGARMLLANAYHFHLRPGEAVVKQLGGLHEFVSWEGP